VVRLLWFNLATDDNDPILGFTTAWIRQAASHVDQLDVITMRAGHIDVPSNVSVYSVGKERGFSEARRAYEFYRILGGLVRRHRYDACFAHMIPIFAVMASPVLRPFGVPITLWHTHRAVTPILRLAAHASAHIVTASSDSFGFPSRKLIVTGHGIDTDLFRPIPDHARRGGPFTISVVGRISPIKRLEMALRGVTLFAAAHPGSPLLLRFVGPVLDPQYAAELWRKAASSGLSRHVEFTGAVPYSRMPAVYQSSDLVVSTSVSGLFDKAPLEAMSCGVPVITANPAFADAFGGLDVPLPPPIAEGAALASSIAEELAQSAEAQRDRSARLRAAIITHHGLVGLMPRLLQTMSGDRGRSARIS
jgi:glycosyltransferase involved in cell wall biosynthesis